MYNFTRLLAAPLLLVALHLSAAERTIGNLIFTYTVGSTEASVRMIEADGSENTAIPQSVTIPRSVTIDGATYDVTSIDNYGFTAPGSPYGYSYWDGVDPTEYSCFRDDYGNLRLKEVKFELPSNVRHIGQSAFQGCAVLESIVIPNSVESMGSEVFTECYSLTTAEFQTDDDGRVKLKALPKNAFSLCPRLQTLTLPEGIESIGDYAIQDCLSLRSIHLPNTLKTIGGHFLCNAKSLAMLTIPASVERIDGAFLHGCESLRTVYLLGQAASLAATFSEESETASSSFDAFPDSKGGTVTTAPSSEKVNHCTFYVPSDYYDSYVSSDVWKQLHSANNTDGNDIKTPLPGGQRTLGAEKWQTVIFYKPVASYKSVFGDGCMVARLTSATADDTDASLYHLDFTLIDGTDIPAKEPLLIYSPTPCSTLMFDADDEATDDFKTFYNTPHITEVEVGNQEGTTVQMIGMGAKFDLVKWDFYFKWDDTQKVGRFFRVPDNKSGITSSRFGCFWRVKRDGLQTEAQALGMKAPARPGTSGINAAAADDAQHFDVRIYDLSGRRIDAPASALKKGIYVVGGRKVVVK